MFSIRTSWRVIRHVANKLAGDSAGQSYSKPKAHAAHTTVHTCNMLRIGIKTTSQTNFPFESFSLFHAHPFISLAFVAANEVVSQFMVLFHMASLALMFFSRFSVFWHMHLYYLYAWQSEVLLTLLAGRSRYLFCA